MCGREWSFGTKDESGSTGIWYCRPGKAGDCISKGLRHKETVMMGTVNMSVEAFLLKMETLMAADEWKAGQYELLRHNCNTFCNMLCHDLLGKGIPDWVNRLSRWGSGLSSAIQFLNVAKLVSPACEDDSVTGVPKDAIKPKTHSAWASVSRASSAPDEWETRRVLPDAHGCSPLPHLTGGKIPRGCWHTEGEEEEVWATPTMSPVAFPSPAARLKSPATPVLPVENHHVCKVERCTINPIVA